MGGSDAWRLNWFGKRTHPATNGVHVGALVKIADNASFWNGERVENWVIRRNWYVTGLVDNKATLGKDETKRYTIKIPISTNFLTVIKKADEFSGD